MNQHNPRTLAWHETLELHELVAFSSIGLMKVKKGLKEIKDDALERIYLQTIQDLEKNLQELLQFYPYAPKPGESDEYRMYGDGFLAGDLLAFAKSSVRNYAVAITETATPMLREVLKKQLNGAVKVHERIFNYMYQKGLYPAYDLNKLLENDVKLARKALS
ncbi:spore coat protein [Bacillus sp. CECT 9360]|uniref:spore coat protein n=1 Tax=Bacillus sp. CECT 9360 TaxID=2845821 RepID=UPI001E459119|nr:spore coat protein [Bacillus sp. CECT 9360]CAH0346817.1 Spore coat protein F [Bacillus sp. CECT 9360]